VPHPCAVQGCGFRFNFKHNQNDDQYRAIRTTLGSAGILAGFRRRFRRVPHPCAVQGCGFRFNFKHNQNDDQIPAIRTTLGSAASFARLERSKWPTLALVVAGLQTRDLDQTSSTTKTTTTAFFLSSEFLFTNPTKRVSARRQKS
jgi:hypothetical protein